MEPKRRRDAQAPQRQKGGAKYVRTMLVIGRTMLVMGTPYTSPSKECVWCCYHGGHATTLSCQAYVLVRRHSRPSFVMACVASHRVSLRQPASRTPQPVSNFGPRLKQPCARQFFWPKAKAALRPLNLKAQRAKPFPPRRKTPGRTTLAPTHQTSCSASRARKEKERIASHQLRDLLSRA